MSNSVSSSLIADAMDFASAFSDVSTRSFAESLPEAVRLGDEAYAKAIARNGVDPSVTQKPDFVVLSCMDSRSGGAFVNAGVAGTALEVRNGGACAIEANGDLTENMAEAVELGVAKGVKGFLVLPHTKCGFWTAVYAWNKKQDMAEVAGEPLHPVSAFERAGQRWRPAYLEVVRKGHAAYVAMGLPFDRDERVWVPDALSLEMGFRSFSSLQKAVALEAERTQKMAPPILLVLQDLGSKTLWLYDPKTGDFQSPRPPQREDLIGGTTRSAPLMARVG